MLLRKLTSILIFVAVCSCGETPICVVDRQAGEFCDGNEAVGLPYGDSCHIGEVLSSDGNEATLNVERTFGVPSDDDEITLAIAEAPVLPLNLGFPEEGQALICANAGGIQYASELLEDGTLFGSDGVRAEDAARAFISEDPLDCALAFTEGEELFDCHDQVGCSASPPATLTFLMLSLLFVGRRRTRNRSSQNMSQCLGARS